MFHKLDSTSKGFSKSIAVWRRRDEWEGNEHIFKFQIHYNLKHFLSSNFMLSHISMDCCVQRRVLKLHKREILLTIQSTAVQHVKISTIQNLKMEIAGRLFGGSQQKREACIIGRCTFGFGCGRHKTLLY